MRIIQFLNWHVDTITDYLDVVKEQNFDAIQINPMQPFKHVDGYEWWASYQPLDFKIGNVYGTKEELKTLCEEANKRGIKIIVDVVCNHLANNGAGQETIPHVTVNEKIRNKKEYWKPHTKVNEFKSYEDIIEGSIGLPGLDLKNEELQEIVFNYLEDLKDCGVAGFRFDAAKHIGLPSDGVDFFTKVKDFLEKNNLIGYGEFLDGPNDLGDDLKNTIYDKKNELSKLMYILTDEDSLVEDKSRKVTYVESHDTYLNSWGHTRGLTDEEIVDKYVELTKKYENTLYYVRDRKFGERLFVRDPDRAGFADRDCLYNEKIRQANLNSGNEITNEKLKNNERENIRKEENKMGNERLMEIHHQIAMKVHEIILSKLDKNSTVQEYVNMALLDYDIQTYLNNKLGITPYDDFLFNCITGEFYKERWNSAPLNNIAYPDFCKKVLLQLKESVMNKDTDNGIDDKIRRLGR